MPNGKSLKDKTISALFYSFMGLVVNGGIQFVMGIVLARLLSPQDYGIIGMIMIFMAISQTFIDGGMTTALIREVTVSDDDYSTVFYYNLLLAVVLYIIMFAFAGFVGRFFKEPLLVGIIRVAGLNLVIGSFGLIQRTMLVRQLDFRTQTKIGIISTLVSGSIAVYLAYHGNGVWALVFQMLSMQLITSVLLILHNRWFPLLIFNFDSFKRLFGYGWKMLVTGVLATLYQNIYNLIIGKVYSSVQLGYYTKAKQFCDLVVWSVVTSVSKVSYPVLSSIQNDDEKMKIGFKKIIKNASFLTFPLMIGLAAVAGPLTKVLFGEKWIPMVPYFRILCFTEMTLLHRSLNLNVLQVKGRSDLFLRLDIIKICIGVVSVVVVVYFKMGIYGLLCAVFVNSQIAFFVNAYFSKKFISYSTRSQMLDMMPIGLISISMGVAVYMSGLILSFGDKINLLLQMVIGVVFYVAVSKVARVEELSTMYRMLENAIKKINDIKKNRSVV